MSQRNHCQCSVCEKVLPNLGALGDHLKGHAMGMGRSVVHAGKPKVRGTGRKSVGVWAQHSSREPVKDKKCGHLSVISHSYGYICQCGRAFYESRKYDYLRHLRIHGITRKYPGKAVWVRWTGQGRNRTGVEVSRPPPRSPLLKRPHTATQSSRDESAMDTEKKRLKSEIEKAKLEAAARRREEVRAVPQRETLTLEDVTLHSSPDHETEELELLPTNSKQRRPTICQPWKEGVEVPSSDEEEEYSPTCPERGMGPAYSPQYISGVTYPCSPDLGDFPPLAIDLETETALLTSLPDTMVELAPLSLATTPGEVDVLQTTNPLSHEDVGKVSTPSTVNEQNEEETSASPVKDGPVPIAGSLQKNEEEEGPPAPSAEGGPPQIMGSPQPTEGDKKGTLLAPEDGLQHPRWVPPAGGGR